ncbi:alkaline phosphatase [Novosphingobium chloroacetimidivorans]|uniref:Alkaline phosphatase n=1 Tax=Novosphingobium chloroacetimidivorans TaxID=1428314 RepID=A0A7W7K8C9_9SPHN|nr:alkaline phosphatase [Novosphingobium chloroacetimidivorans]MBB4857559.1 alkaline phosphatase [Novosphingobium chloroacetimidivorans]
MTYPPTSRTRLRKVAALLAGMVALVSAPLAAKQEPQRARNVILFLGDAGGLSTLNAAGILAHDKPQSLYIQSMPHIGLSDTSSTDRWVTDSAAGMTAIMTGRKTGNGVVSMAPGPGGAPLKTLLEYAEERGLSTGVVTNMKIWDATPAACYAHAASRKSKDEIFAQMLRPRFGNGVDILLGKGKADALASFSARGTSAQQAFTGAGYRFGDDPALIGSASRAVVLRDEDYAPLPAVSATVKQLARNPKGYFLMVEWDMHTDDPQAGLRHVIEMDDMIRQISAQAGKDTLILFTADHSFGLRLMGGKRGTPLQAQFDAEATKPGATPANNAVIPVDDGHSGEEVIAAASGPGAERVRGFFPNTQLFDVMLEAFGWR